jgi:hypothetical protein
MRNCRTDGPIRHPLLALGAAVAVVAALLGELERLAARPPS